MDKQDLLQQILDYYKKIESLHSQLDFNRDFPLNTFWGDQNMKEMTTILERSRDAQEAVHSIQNTWLFSINSSETVKENAVDWLLENQRKVGLDLFQLDAEMQESRFSNPQNNVLRNKRILTPDFLRTVSIAHEIANNLELPSSGFKVLELGAGCGHLARTLRLRHEKYTHVIIDIPESMCFSYMFLRLNFPEAKTWVATSEGQLKDLDFSDYDFVFVPSALAEEIAGSHFDLFINTASLGEMKNPVIRYWMDLIQEKLKVDNLFTLNRFLNTILTDGSHDWRMEENECSVSYDPDWEILKWELEPLFTRCPYIDTQIARYVQICARRNHSVEKGSGEPQRQQDLRKRSDELIASVRNEDWIRLERTADEVMTMRDNLILHDLSQTGTLFKLWNSIRLCPQRSNVALMLKFLETLNHQYDKEFEEVFYYENLFETLPPAENDPSLDEIQKSIELKRLIRKSHYNPASYLFPPRTQNVTRPFLLGEYREFNILVFKSQFYGVAQELGPIDWRTTDFKKLIEEKTCFIGDSMDDVKQKIRKASFEKIKGIHFKLDDKPLSPGTTEIEDRKPAPVSSEEIRFDSHEKEIASIMKEVERLQTEFQGSSNTFKERTRELERKIEELNQNLGKNNEENEALNKEIRCLQESLEDANSELTSIKSTRWYNMMSYLGKQGFKILK